MGCIMNCWKPNNNKKKYSSNTFSIISDNNSILDKFKNLKIIKEESKVMKFFNFF